MSRVERLDGADTVTHRHVLAIAVPMTLAYLSTPILGIVDTTVIGRLGSASLLGGIAVGAIIFNVLFTSFNFLRSGTTGLTAQALGANDRLEIRACLYRALLIAVVSGVALIVLAGPFLATGLAFMNASPAVNAATSEYFMIRILSSPFALANYAILGWFIGLGRAGTGLALQVLLNGLNIVLNIWFVMGLGWGIAGVAWGTALGEAITAMVGLWLAYRQMGPGQRPAISAILDKVRFLKLLALNGDIMIRSFSLVFAFAYFASRGAGQGDVILGANAVLMNFFLAASFFLDGFATAAEQLAGKTIGARRPQAFRTAVSLTLLWGFCLAGFASAVFWFTGPLAINLMTTNAEVRAAAHVFLIWAALTPLSGVLAFQFDGVFIGATWSNDMRNMMLIALAAFLASVHLLMSALGNHGLWVALHVFLLTRGITLMLRYPVRLRAFSEKVGAGLTTGKRDENI